MGLANLTRVFWKSGNPVFGPVKRVLDTDPPLGQSPLLGLALEMTRYFP